MVSFVFFFKQKTAYEMRISDWSSDVCSSDLMKTIMAKVGFKGTLQQFFVHLRTSPQYFHKTRDAYLAEVDAHVKAMEARLPAFFKIGRASCRERVCQYV